MPFQSQALAVLLVMAATTKALGAMSGFGAPAFHACGEVPRPLARLQSGSLPMHAPSGDLWRA